MGVRVAFAAAAVVVLTVSSAAAALDPSFGTEGKVVTAFPDRSSNVNALAVQRNGRIVAVGWAWNEERGDFALARYDPAGRLDTSFGSGGTVTTDVGGGYARAVAVQADGKILAAGEAGGAFALARYLPDGSLDRTFGGDGMVATALPGRSWIVRVLTTRRGILAIGNAARGEEPLVQRGLLVLARYRYDGTLDTRFGKRGLVTRAGFGPIAAAPAPGGKIVVSSPRVVQPLPATDPDIDIRLLRYLPDGRLDRAFGGDGIVVRRARPHSTGLSALAVQPDGKVVVGGHGHAAFGPAPSAFMLVRFRADGSPDRSFGDGGTAVGEVGFGIRALAADGTGIVAAGASEGLQDFAVVRFTAAGRLDATFGTLTTDFGAYETPWAVAVQADGAVVAAGQTGRGLLVETDFALARYR